MQTTSPREATENAVIAVQRELPAASKMAQRGIAKLLKSYHLRPVKSMRFTFDPFSTNVRSIRLVWTCVSGFPPLLCPIVGPCWNSRQGHYFLFSKSLMSMTLDMMLGRSIIVEHYDV